MSRVIGAAWQIKISEEKIKLRGIKMRMLRILMIFAFLAVQGAGLALKAQTQPAGAPAGPPSVPGLTLTTTAFDDGSIIPPKFTQGVPNPISPKLQWTNVPANTVTFVLIVHDPDGAPGKKLEDVLHWMVFNIPGAAREIPEDLPPNPQLADGSIQAKNTRGAVGYRGPGAGPAGPYHHYTFELYALDMKLDLGPDATHADVFNPIDGHILGKAVLVGRFHR
jgi:Raf kinase inhibitor-like YbhB/YbcL family protein